PTGPALYHQRREAWLTPRSMKQPSSPPPPSPSQKRLEQLLGDHADGKPPPAWNNGLETVWNGLAKGNKLRHQLPLQTVVKIVHRAWIHDKTWPSQAVVPESDE
ncbi:hypothetical protein BDV98DRAFT_474739, partial [Pterulicium gracile]